MASITISQIKDMVYQATDPLLGPPHPQRIEQCKSVLGQVLLKHPDEYWANLWMGGLLNRAGDYPGALAFLHRALQLEPGIEADIANNVGAIYRLLNHNDIALKYFHRAIELSPDNDGVLNNLGTVHVNEGEPALGLPYLERAIAIDPGKPHPHWNRSLCLLELGRYGEGFTEYVWGHTTHDRPAKRYIDSRGRNVGWWYGEHVGTLVVFGEQGIGDEVMFLSMVPDLMDRCDQLILDVHPRLVSVVKRSFRKALVYGTRKEWNIIPQWAAGHTIDAKASIGLCAKYLRPSPTCFQGDPWAIPGFLMEREAHRAYNIGDRPVVGLSWTGGSMHTRDDYRSFRLEDWLPILEQDAQFISVHYKDCAAEIDDFTAKTGIPITHLSEWTESKYDEKYEVWVDDKPAVTEIPTKEDAHNVVLQLGGKAKIKHHPGPAFDADRHFAVLANCDIVITANQSNVWFGGALGVPTWTLTPDKCAWRYGHSGENSLWYRYIRQFRQNGDWGKTIQRVADILESELPAYRKG